MKLNNNSPEFQEEFCNILRKYDESKLDEGQTLHKDVHISPVYFLNFEPPVNGIRIPCITSFEKSETLMMFVSEQSVYFSAAEKLKKAAFKFSKNVDLQDKSIFRFPKLALPRNKVNLLKDKYNLKVVRDYKKADYNVVSENYLTSQFTRSWLTVMRLDQLLERIKEHSAHYDKSIVTFLEEKRKELGNILIKPEAHSYYRGDADYRKAVGFYRMITGRRAYYIQSLDVFKLIKLNNLVLDSELSLKTSDGLATLTEEHFDVIDQMINSSNETDQIMALEMMSNCDFVKSHAIIVYLVSKYSDRIKDFKNYNSVNVKTLREYTKDYTVTRYSSSSVRFYDNIVIRFKNDGKLTPFIVKRISIDMLNDLYANVGFGNSSPFELKIEDIRLKPEYIEALEASQAVSEEE
ncbi:MAG: hypothetical protein HRT87_06955 [Legionellales bacterium]|nr:hypothetical protein [Legionellales bacterium]